LPVRSSAVDKVTCLFSRIHQLPHLETINLAFHSSYGDTPDIDSTVSLALQTSILGALATSFSVRAPPNLVSLSLCNLRTSDFSALESPEFQSILTNLRRLRFSMLFGTAPDPYTFVPQWCYLWCTLCPRSVLAPTQGSLTALALRSDAYVGAPFGLSLSAL